MIKIYSRQVILKKQKSIKVILKMQKRNTHVKQINPIKNWQVNRDDIKFIGKNLQRPECILAELNGTVWAADARGGLMKINADGTQQLHLENMISNLGNTEIANTKSEIEKDNARYIQAQGSLPNGICFDTNGDFIIANWGTNHIERMTRDGKLTTILTEIDGVALCKTNFPLRDSKGKIWFTVTTKTEPWSNQINSREKDGYIAVIDKKGARIVADGLCGTNEIRFDDEEEWLYVVESTGKNISRFRVHQNGTLSNSEVYGPSQLDGFPDGFAFDAFGNLWITLIFTDILIALRQMAKC